MKQNRTSVQTINGYFNRFNPLKALALVMALAFVQGETFASSREDVTISAPAAASVSISGALRICAGGTTTLTANVSGCTGTPSYAWFRNGVFTANAGASTFVADNAGDYRVRVTCGGETVFSETVKVSQFRLKTLVQNACPGETGNVNLVLIDPQADGISEFASFNWSNGTTNEDLMGVPSGLYTVVAQDINGCYASTTALVQNTIVNVNAGPNKTVCTGGSVELNGSGADFYEWSPAASLSSAFAVNPMASPAVNTTYTLTGYVNSGDLVNNGDFNQRNVGFTSDYAFVAGFAVGGYASGTGLYPEGKYSVVPNRTDTNVTKMHPSFKGVGHNKGLAAGENDDFYMAINGSSTLGQVVWSQTVEVLPNTNYNFATWISSINLGNLSRLRFQINGIALGAEIVAPNALNTWSPFFTVWNSGSATQAEIKIINNNLVTSGNDFGLDDISFSVTCSATDQVDVTVLPPLTGNSITCPQVTSFCLTGDAAMITGSAPAGGNGSYTYQWEVSDDNQTFSPIDGATDANFNPGPVNATTYFRRKVISGDCSINSNVCTITITSQGTVANNVLTSPSPSSFCSSGNPGNIVGTNLNEGLNNPGGLTTYIWESTTDGNEWFVIEGASGASFDPASISMTTSYRRIARQGACLSGVSNVITITVNPLPVVVIPAPAQRCGPGILTLEANAPGTIRWFAAAQGGQALATGSIYTLIDLQQTTNYFVEASNLGCTSARTLVPAVINAKPTITSTTPGFRCGAGNASVSAVASAGDVKWFADADGLIALGSGNSISVPVTESSSVFVGANDEGCASASLTEVAIEVGANTTASVSATACDSYTWALNGQTYTSSGAYTYESENEAGCTLTTTLNLTINTSSAVTLNVSINEGDSYAFNGENLTTGGTYTMNSTGANGCPMVTTLNLTVVPDTDPADCGTNKIVNGDFEAGNTGFSSAYTFTADVAGNSEMIPENRIAVGTNANNYHPQFIGTGRTGKFLIVNGNKQTVKELWAQDVDVVSGREYVFTMYTQNLYPTAPPRFSFRITPNDLISSPVEFGTFNATTGRNGWIEVTATYNAEYTGSARLSIYDIDLTAFGNDFGIDDISFVETCPVGCSPVEVVSYNPGPSSDFLTPIAADRQNTDNALGAPELSDVETSASNYNFVTLGFAGDITLKFAYPIKNGEGDDLYVVETSFGASGNQNCTRYPEKIRAYASQDNCNWVYLGEGCQNTYFDLQGLNWAQYVKIVDMTNPESFDGLVDGYDLDGVVCLHGEELNPVPTDLVFGSAQEIISYEPGMRKNLTPVVDPRRIPANALGVPQNNNTVNFVSLGFGGSLVVKFDYVIFDAPGVDVQMVETSFGNPSCAGYSEKAMVEGSLFENGPWTLLSTNGDFCLDGGIDVAAAGVVQYLRVTDRTIPGSFSGTADGYDVDGFIVSNNCANANAKFAAHTDNNETANEVASSSVYPNPFSDFVNVAISTGDLDKTATIKVVNYLGQQVFTHTLSVTASSEVSTSLNLSNLSSGVYFLTVETNNSRETMKVVKK